MKEFFKFFFASCLGFVVGMGLLILLGFSIFAGILSQSEQVPVVQSNTVLHLVLSDYIPEHTNNLETNSISLKNEKYLGLHEIRKTLQNAAKDDNIEGIFLESEMILSNGIGSVRTLRKALEEFQSSGKFIIAYAKAFSQGGYYTASVSDHIVVNPLGLLDIKGFAAQIPFYKEMLDKVGVDMQVFYAGQYKGATEPYRLKKMSPQNRMQIRSYLNEMYEVFLDDISASRPVDKASLRKIISNYAASRPEDAQKLNLIDKAGYRDEALSWMKEKLALDSDANIKFMSLKSYNKANPPSNGSYKIKDKIAVVYAEGGIIDGNGSNGSIGDKKYSEVFNKIRKDDNVKAVVLRVNSPGGSGLAAENMHRELLRLKETGKPLVVSMGDYAASAGYYIAAPADYIIAGSNTLTGSIGVFLLLPNGKDLLNEKLGIRFDTVQTGDFSAGLTPLYDLSTKEKTWLQNRTDEMYQIFLERVADGRDMSKEEVHKIAQGRVWTGPQAIQIGLVDEIGELQDAVDMAAKLAEISEYRIREYPYIKPQLTQLIEDLTGESTSGVMLQGTLQAQFPDLYPYYKQYKTLKETKGLQARLPFMVPFN